jgi:hypothetical protein
MKYHDKVHLDWEKIGDRTCHWSNYFPNFGMCMFHSKHNQAYIPIPRCSSQYLCNFLEKKYGWVGNHVQILSNLNEAYGKWKKEYQKDLQYFSIIRDPLERYISALWVLYNPETRLLHNHRMDRTQLDQLFLNPSLDDHHTINQYNYFYNIDHNKVNFFHFNDKNLGEKLEYFFKKQDIKFDKKNWMNKDSEEKEIILKLFEDNPDYLQTVKTYLEDDYKFLSTIKYYEPN